MKAFTVKHPMKSIAGPIFGGIRIATATFKRRLLLALALSLIVAIPTYAAIISNQTQHNVTIQDVTITSTPAGSSIQPSGSTETGTVTVSTPQTFTGKLTLSITNTTATTGPIIMNPVSFIVTINGGTVTGLAIPGIATIPYVSQPTSISGGYVFTYTIRFLSKTEDAINGIQSGTTYQISQLVSE